MNRIEELQAENQRLREANRRLQQEGVALERDKLIIQLRAEIVRLTEEVKDGTICEMDDCPNSVSFEMPGFCIICWNAMVTKLRAEIDVLRELKSIS